MIIAENLSKKFDKITALENVNLIIDKGEIFGLIGSNGAGKSTFLRLATGVLKPDAGIIQIDDENVYENDSLKSKLFYISDEQFFFSDATPRDMMDYYRIFYHNFDVKRFEHLINAFDLDLNRKIRTFSKGMKKQVSVICGICSNVDYLFCDETFDGLDPSARQAVKSLFAEDVLERQLTPVIASHNLRELEDICDHVGLLHKGGVLLSENLEEMKLGIHKIQCAFDCSNGLPDFSGLDIISNNRRGSLFTITARGAADDFQAEIMKKNPLFMELLPLTLEEIFIAETEVAGYDIKKLLF